MKETYGVPVEEIQEGIRHGVRKVNIDTDIRLAMTAAIRKYLHENPGKFDPREYLKPAMLAAKEICRQRYEQFGCAGQASKIKPVPLDRIAARYKAGELRQIVGRATRRCVVRLRAGKEREAPADKKIAAPGCHRVPHRRDFTTAGGLEDPSPEKKPRSTRPSLG